MTGPASVVVRSLAKSFPLHRRRQFKGISPDSFSAFSYLMGRTVVRGRSNADLDDRAELFCALDKVSFKVASGEVLGIIGRNGAGKSTLLKILARVLEPTAGKAIIRGRVVSLLELGIGFAPDLTVRENIQIYGRLAGIPAARINASEDEILEFARLTKYREVPLERCPSGSFVQLAFSAMISLKADVILADEVLAVGDSEFRHAGEERIRAVAKTGEAVLFVSHDMNAITRCCTRVLWLDRGRVRQVGAPDEIVHAYISELTCGQLTEASTAETAQGCRLLDLRLLDGNREQIGALQITEPSYVECLLRIERTNLAATVQIELWQGKVHVLSCIAPHPIRASAPASYRVAIRLPGNFLNDTNYQALCRVYVSEDNMAAGPGLACEERLNLTVMNPSPQNSVWANWAWGRGGAISPRLRWSVSTA